MTFRTPLLVHMYAPLLVRIGFFTGICLFVFTQTPPVEATQVIAYSEREQVERSALIVWGRVQSQITRKIGPRQYIATDSTLTIRRIFKGKILTNTLMVRCLGGRIGTQTAHVAGAGQLAVGEEVLVFLEAARPLPWQLHPTHYYLTGMAYGLWKMRWSPMHRQYQLFQQHDLPTRLARNAQGRWVPLPHLHTQPRLLSDLVQTLQRYPTPAQPTPPKTNKVLRRSTQRLDPSQETQQPPHIRHVAPDRPPPRRSI